MKWSIVCAFCGLVSWVVCFFAWVEEWGGGGGSRGKRMG